jgi:hypothetical protein
MNAAPASMEHRARVLRALGVTPWRRRAVSLAAGAVEAEAVVADIDPSLPADCVVLVPTGCAPRELDLLGRACCAFGAELARAGRIEVGDGVLASVPSARAYLVFGEAQAHALGRVLSADALQRAHIVLADAPAAVLADAAGKRRLWSALRGLRRALASRG